MKTKLGIGILAATIVALTFGCAGKPASTTSSSSTGDNRTAANASAPAGDNASTVVKSVYDKAMKRDCAAIPSMLTPEFAKEVGTSKDALDALCDTFTDSGKLTSFEVKGEDASGDSATVKVTLNYKDGKKEDTEEKMKKSGGKWLMDS